MTEWCNCGSSWKHQVNRGVEPWLWGSCREREIAEEGSNVAEALRQRLDSSGLASSSNGVGSSSSNSNTALERRKRATLQRDSSFRCCPVCLLSCDATFCSPQPAGSEEHTIPALLGAVLSSVYRLVNALASLPERLESRCTFPQTVVDLCQMDMCILLRQLPEDVSSIPCSRPNRSEAGHLTDSSRWSLAGALTMIQTL